MSFILQFVLQVFLIEHIFEGILYNPISIRNLVVSVKLKLPG